MPNQLLSSGTSDREDRRESKYWIWLAVFLFACYFVVGLSTYADYGMSTDEVIQRHHGKVSFKYILTVIGIDIPSSSFAYLRNIVDLQDYPHKSYGVIFHLPLFVIEHLMQGSATGDVIWEVRHLYTFCWFFIGAVFFFRLARHWLSTPFAILATVLMVTSPRIYADSFYNPKDTAFLAVFNVALFYAVTFLRYPSHRTAAAFAVATAFMVNVRFYGIFLPAFVAFLFVAQSLRLHRQELLLRAKPLLTFLLVATACTIALWPAAWSNPFQFFLETFLVNTDYAKWKGQVLYMGHWYRGNALPWHYIPIWILISTPLHHLLLLAMAFMLSPGMARRYAGTSLAAPSILILMVLLIPPALAIAMKSTLYGNWRHFYFLQAPLSLLALLPIQYLMEKPNSASFGRKLWSGAKWLPTALLMVGIAYNTSWLMRHHPYQLVYFNSLAIHYVEGKFNLSSWSTPTRQAIQYIAQTDDRNKISISSKLIRENFLMIDPVTKARLQWRRTPNDADYVIDYTPRNAVPPFSEENWIPIKTLEIDGIRVMRIMKRRSEQADDQNR